MAGVAAGYRKGLVSAGCPTPPLSCTGSFQSGGAFPGRRAQTIECSVMSGCGQGHEPAKKLLKEAVDQVSRVNSWQKWKYR